MNLNVSKQLIWNVHLSWLNPMAYICSVHSIAEQNIQLHISIRISTNVFALCSEFVRPPCPYLVFPLNALWCLLTTTTEKDISLDDEMVHCVTMPLQIWLAIRALWLVNTSMARLSYPMIRLCAQNSLRPDDSYIAILFSHRRCIFVKHSRYMYKIRELCCSGKKM